MTGEYEHSLDAKGRLFIPARLREELGEEFYLTLSMSEDSCLYARSVADYEEYRSRVMQRSEGEQRLFRPYFVNAVRVTLDTQGRVLIPQKLRDWAGLSKNVTVLGVNNHAELWDSDAWAKQSERETSRENLAAIMRELGF